MQETHDGVAPAAFVGQFVARPFQRRAGRFLAQEAKQAGVVYTGAAGDEPACTLELIGFEQSLGLKIVCAGKGKNNPLKFDAVPADYEQEARERNMNARMLVEFVDGSVLAQLSTTDMCFPIQYAVTWPERVSNRLPPLDFAALARLDFEAPRWDDFPALRLAKEAGSTGGTLPAVLNAANEIAVSAFLEGHLSFPGIWNTVERTMALHRTATHPSLEEIIEADRWARETAASQLTRT